MAATAAMADMADMVATADMVVMAGVLTLATGDTAMVVIGGVGIIAVGAAVLVATRLTQIRFVGCGIDRIRGRYCGPSFDFCEPGRSRCVSWRGPVGHTQNQAGGQHIDCQSLKARLKMCWLYTNIFFSASGAGAEFWLKKLDFRYRH
jgi:hypothetical protein